ncbi:autophagy-related protein [Flagelloscypha sp. PMI_526]|nr:autophagy-related protein [Flagelloscypha sp. PMI_526]
MPKSCLRATMTTTHPIISIDLILDQQNTRPVLSAVLHSILFHRLFGHVKPQTFEVLDVTMPGVVDPEMESLIKSKVDAFWKGVQAGGAVKKGQISVKFCERRQKKTGWFTVMGGEEDVPWEQWLITAEVRQYSPREKEKFESTLSQALTKAVYTMLTHTSSEKGRHSVPIIQTADFGISPFPLEITVDAGWC